MSVSIQGIFPSVSPISRLLELLSTFGVPPSLMSLLKQFLFWIIYIDSFLILSYSDGSVSQSQDDSIVGTRQCRHSLAIMPIPGTLSSSSPDLLQPTTSMLDFSNPSGEISLFLL